MKLYWGDIHAHCGISYGEGTLESALAAAAGHLDFCSVTGHARWPDMPTDRSQYGAVIDYHRTGFDRLEAAWPQALTTMKEYNRPGSFVVFPSWEWHSLKYGDHNVYFRDDAAPLLDASSPDEIKRKTRDLDALVIPHHIGYPKGMRGLDWDSYREERSPFIEIFSMHGCSESDEAPFPYLHDMGPRDSLSLASAGLRRGLHFGFAASTDTHTGYPGHYGGGKVGVWATALTKEALWDAFCNRRLYAVTGDRIEVDFRVDDAPMGSIVRTRSANRTISISLKGSDALNYYEVIRNGSVIAHVPGRWPDCGTTGSGRWKFRIEWGWGSKESPTLWEGEVRFNGGQILSVEKCFRGGISISPMALDIARVKGAINDVVEQTATRCSWVSTTIGNPSLLDASTNSLVFEVAAMPTAEITIVMNGTTHVLRLGELAQGSRAWPTKGWLSESVCAHRAIPSERYEIEASIVDAHSGEAYYYCRVVQHNGQWAWGSPIWVEGS